MSEFPKKNAVMKIVRRGASGSRTRRTPRLRSGQFWLMHRSEPRVRLTKLPHVHRLAIDAKIQIQQWQKRNRRPRSVGGALEAAGVMSNDADRTLGLAFGINRNLRSK
jgi:hypothetical protein